MLLLSANTSSPNHPTVRIRVSQKPTFYFIRFFYFLAHKCSKLRMISSWVWLCQFVSIKFTIKTVEPQWQLTILSLVGPVSHLPLDLIKWQNFNITIDFRFGLISFCGVWRFEVCVLLGKGRGRRGHAKFQNSSDHDNTSQQIIFSFYCFYWQCRDLRWIHYWRNLMRRSNSFRGVCCLWHPILKMLKLNLRSWRWVITGKPRSDRSGENILDEYF